MITGIYFLSSKDFSLKESIEGKLLSLDNDIKGIQLVLFYSNTCEFCDNVMKEFKKLPEKVMGCSFSMINVNHNNDVVQLSKQTVSPLTYVPELILFIDNLPYIKYEGDPTIDEIQKFLPDANISYVERNEDPRDYRVNFNKIARILNFKITKTVPDGIAQVLQVIRDGFIKDPDSKVYRNI